MTISSVCAMYHISAEQQDSKRETQSIKCLQLFLKSDAEACRRVLGRDRRTDVYKQK